MSNVHVRVLTVNVSMCYDVCVLCEWSVVDTAVHSIHFIYYLQIVDN